MARTWSPTDETAAGDRRRVAGIALAAASGFALGLLAGLLAGEWLGGVDAGRVRRTVHRLRGEAPEPGDPTAVRRAVQDALRADPATGSLEVRVRVLDQGLLELIGRAPSAEARERAAVRAQAAAPGWSVVNRLLVEGDDLPHGAATARPT
jgi:hypothetical protein